MPYYTSSKPYDVAAEAVGILLAAGEEYYLMPPGVLLYELTRAGGALLVHIRAGVVEDISSGIACKKNFCLFVPGSLLI